MKLFLISLFVSCQLFSQNIEKTALLNTWLDQWHIAVAQADFNAYFDKMAPNFVYVGTDAFEVWTKKEFVDFSKVYFDKKQTWNFKPIERNIYFSEDYNIAWFDEILNTWMGVCRGSGVMVKNGNKWFINHYVLSVTIQNENINDVIEIKKEKKSFILESLKNN